mmetsp:Transcript_13581/g.37504  ORF Transcript_13581/g.37504 Transcript_13581/m.37504 type:complete len:86 (-) Transcript_13581:1256-1513(-)
MRYASLFVISACNANGDGNPTCPEFYLDDNMDVQHCCHCCNCCEESDGVASCFPNEKDSNDERAAAVVLAVSMEEPTQSMTLKHA